MKKLTLAIAFAMIAAPAFAGYPVSVPEMDVGAGVLALAFLAGAGAIIREKFFRK
ncbi:MAG TPA: hypothetical protein VNH64_06845 [Parvularculaceae bacterium]|nr:hypothetical protein [Parvularculaceae bacterium]